MTYSAMPEFNKETLLELFDAKMRRNGRFVGRHVERLERVTRVTGPSADQLDNLITWSNLDESTADGVIDEQIAHFARIRHHFEWLMYGHDQPHNLVDRLNARGFEHESNEEVVVAPSADIGEFEPPENIDVRALDDPARVVDVMAVQSVDSERILFQSWPRCAKQAPYCQKFR